MQQTNRFRGDQWRLLGGFGNHRIAGHERRRDLADKNRQRKIPWRDRNECAAPAQLEHIAFAGGAGHGFAIPEQLPTLRRVIAAEIHRLANLRKRVVEGLAALALQQRNEVRVLLLQEIRRALQDFRACRGRCPAPTQETFPRGYYSFAHELRSSLNAYADDSCLIARAEDRALLA